MRYTQYMTEQLRLSVLRILQASPEYSNNDHLLMAALPSIGFALSQDTIRAELRFLEETGLVTLRDVEGGLFLVAKLTNRGDDVANGRAQVDGVARPRPGP